MAEMPEEDVRGAEEQGLGPVLRTLGFSGFMEENEHTEGTAGETRRCGERVAESVAVHMEATGRMSFPGHLAFLERKRSGKMRTERHLLNWSNVEAMSKFRKCCFSKELGW